MMIYYDSRTGNVERFIRKVVKMTGWNCVKVNEAQAVTEPGHFITYTTKIGCVPESTQRFMAENYSHILSVSSSGNMNWGANFALAADKLSAQYGIPILLKFELSGLERDVNLFVEQAKAFMSVDCALPPSSL